MMVVVVAMRTFAFFLLCVMSFMKWLGHDGGTIEADGQCRSSWRGISILGTSEHELQGRGQWIVSLCNRCIEWMVVDERAGKQIELCNSICCISDGSPGFDPSLMHLSPWFQPNPGSFMTSTRWGAHDIERVLLRGMVDLSRASYISWFCDDKCKKNARFTRWKQHWQK